MDRPSVFAKSLRRGSVTIILASVLLVTTVFAQEAPSQSGDDETMRHLGQYFRRVATEQFDRGYYIEAEKTFEKARGYADFLDPLERRKLESQLEKARLAAVERKRALEAKQAGEGLFGKGQAAAARAHLENIQSSAFLTEKERLEVRETLRVMGASQGSDAPGGSVPAEGGSLLGDHPGAQAGPSAPADALDRYRNSIADTYYESAKAYHSGDFKTAKTGFAKVLESGLMPAAMAEVVRGYLAEIESTQAKPENGRPVVLPEATVGTLRPVNAMIVTDTSAKYPAANVSGAGEPQSEKERIDALYNRSWELYLAGELDAARRGFVEVAQSGLFTAPEGKRPEDYIATIDRLLAPSDGTQDRPLESTPTPPLAESVTQQPEASQPAEEGSFIDTINRRRNIIRSHTQAVVSDAVNQAQRNVAQGKFGEARDAIYDAQRIVDQNQLHLGDELYKQYSRRLSDAADNVARAEQARERQLAEERREGAIEAQRELRQQAETDRQQKISELMVRAKAYQAQQRYEAALGQVESVVAIDPLNDEALTLKQILEDMVYLRKQLDLRAEGARQRADILLGTDEAGIPYAEEVTYPKNWREIAEKRQPEEPIGLNPANTRVYKQLEEIVDLSMLTPEMPFSEAVAMLKSTVQPPLNIVVLWKDLLDNATIEPSTPIDMDGLPNVTLGTALENLLNAVAGGFAEVGYVVNNGVITVATEEGLPQKKMETRVYDVSDLLGEPANYRGMGGMMGGMGGMMGGMGGMGGMMGGMGGMGGGMGGYGGGMGGGMMGGMGGMGGGMMGGMGGMGGGMGGYGGGMGGMGGGMGGMGGMGGYGGGMGGMGGMGGGMGGMGGYGGGMMGGMGGMGGMMGGMGGGMMGGMMGRYMAMSLRQLIQESIDPESWFELSDYGEGTVMVYPQDQPKKLAVYQSPEVHKQVADLLDQLRISLGHQVSIEARFLVVSENFMEDIGLDLDFSYNLGGKWGLVTVDQDSFSTAGATPSGRPGSLGGSTPAGSLTGGYGSVLDDLQVSLVLRATQARGDSKSLAAPKVTVLSGESASFYLMDEVSYALPPTQTQGTLGTTGGVGLQQQGTYQNVGMTMVGSTLSITPTITKDKKNVLLNIMTNQQDLLGFRTHMVSQVVQAQQGTQAQTAGQVLEYPIEVPEREISNVMTRVSVPDRGTLLLGGHKITAEMDREAGVPVLNKIPILGRLFTNRSKVRDNKILLILVKPTIILQEEREREAIAAMEESSYEYQY